MAVKRKHQKKHLKKLLEEAPILRCRYCDIRDNCRFRRRKEKYEEMGVMTGCLMTPNRPKRKKWNRRNKKKRA